MALILPSKPVPATRVNPKITIIYGVPKVGKTKELTEIEQETGLRYCILDAEQGADVYDCVRFPINSTKDIYDFALAVEAEGRARYDAGLTGDDAYPYHVLALDTLDKVQDFCEVSATYKYKNSVIGKSFKGDTVTQLDHGAGYYYLREELKAVVQRLANVCKYLILICHVKDNNLMKDGIMVNSKDLSLTGKISEIMAALADVIGYMYREPGKPMMINFETLETGVMGARFPRLAGKKMEMDWSKIFIPETVVTPNTGELQTAQ